MKEKLKKIDLYYVALFMIFISVIFVSVGYAVLSGSVTISGDLVYRVPQTMRITENKLTAYTNNAIISYTPYHKVATASFGSKLPALNSTMTYQVTIKNETANIKKVSGISTYSDSNSSIGYTVSGYNIGSPIMPGESITITLLFKYNTNITTLPSNTIDDCTLLFAYEDMQLTASNLSYSNALTNLPCTDAQCAIEKIYEIVR